MASWGEVGVVAPELAGDRCGTEKMARWERHPRSPPPRSAAASAVDCAAASTAQ